MLYASEVLKVAKNAKMGLFQFSLVSFGRYKSIFGLNKLKQTPKSLLNIKIKRFDFGTAFICDVN